MTSPSSLVGTTLLERYRVDALLGEGGMGAVYVGEHLLLSKRVAIKVLHPDMLENSEVVARFQREALASAHIDHPNVAVATDFGKLEDGSSFLVLEYLEGKSVRDLLDQGGAFDAERALRITRQIAAALVRAHGLGIVHRDLKPDNVMLVERDGDPDFVKVLDFGIAKVPVKDLVGAKLEAPAANGLTKLGVMYGTPEYMAPEQILGHEIDTRADLYALGVMLHEMLVGRRPFEDPNRVAIVTMHLTQPPTPVSRLVPGIAPAVEELVLGLLEKEPPRRIQTAREVVERIEELLGIQGSRVRPSMVSASGPSSVPTFAAVSPAASARTAIAPSPIKTPVGGHPSFLAELEARVAPLRARLPKPLLGLPLLVFAVVPVGLALGITIVVLLAIVLRGGGEAPKGQPATSGTAAPIASTVSDDDLREARRKGAQALLELRAKHPDDGRVARALVTALADEKRRLDAMRHLRESLPKDKTIADDSGVQRAVKAAAEDTEGDDLAFELMQGPLGPVGADLLYDLQASTRPGVAARASKALARPEVKELSPAVAIAIDFRAALSCDGKKALLGRVREQGDRRLLPHLRNLRAPAGCGFLRRQDCWPCLRQGTELADTIREVEGRSTTLAPSD